MTYAIINNIISSYEATTNAAESHGIASGMLCLDHQEHGMSWLSEVFQDTFVLKEEDKSLMLSLFEQTKSLLTGDDFSFDLLIPDDDFSLDEQAEGVRNWCQGFLVGLGTNSANEQWPSEVDEIVKDLIEITKLEVEEESDEDQQALIEIHEYIRAAVMLISEELKTENINTQKQLH